MKKESTTKPSDDLRPEYDLSQRKGGVRGNYYRQATDLFLDSQSVNRALRAVAEAAQAAVASKHRRSTP